MLRAETVDHATNLRHALNEAWQARRGVRVKHLFHQIWREKHMRLVLRDIAARGINRHHIAALRGNFSVDKAIVGMLRSTVLLLNMDERGRELAAPYPKFSCVQGKRGGVGRQRSASATGGRAHALQKTYHLLHLFCGEQRRAKGARS